MCRIYIQLHISHLRIFDNVCACDMQSEEGLCGVNKGTREGEEDVGRLWGQCDEDITAYLYDNVIRTSATLYTN